MSSVIPLTEQEQEQAETKFGKQVTITRNE